MRKLPIPNVKGPKSDLSLIRRHMPDLARAGLNSSEILVLEQVALHLRGARMRLLRGTFIAKAIGRSPQRINTILRRLADLGLIIRLKTGLIMLVPEKLSEISARCVNIVRRVKSNWFKSLVKSRCRNPRFHKPVETKKQRDEAFEIPALNDALAALRALNAKNRDANGNWVRTSEVCR